MKIKELKKQIPHLKLKPLGRPTQSNRSNNPRSSSINVKAATPKRVYRHKHRSLRANRRQTAADGDAYANSVATRESALTIASQNRNGRKSEMASHMYDRNRHAQT